jgi:hypothetical protein
MDLNNLDNFETWQNDGKGNEFNNEISFVRKCFTFFFTINFFYNCVMFYYYYYDTDPWATYLYNDVSNFITDLQSKLSKKLLKYNGHFSDSESSSSSDASSETSETESTDLAVVVKYEDKYLDDIKKMSADYRFSWYEIALRDNKFNELYEAHKINLLNEKHKLNQEIIEKGMKYLEIDDENNYEENINISDEVNSDEFCSVEKDFEKEERKKVVEDEINMLRSKVKELENVSDDIVISKLKLEARDFVVKERLDGLKNNFIMEKTPLGNVIMYWNNSRESFEFYSDNTIPYRYLETVGRKYVKTFNCRSIYVDMEFELSEFERKHKEKQEEDLKLKLLEDKKKMELEQNTSFNSSSSLGLVGKKDVFAKFKNYNKESGTGKVNRGAAPPKNSIPNNNNMKKDDEKVILKENANRYTCEGRLSNFSFLKKPDRKVIDKKYAMSFADYKKSIFKKNGVKEEAKS